MWIADQWNDYEVLDTSRGEKLEGVSDQWSLKTVWGVGYKFEVLYPILSSLYIFLF